MCAEDIEKISLNPELWRTVMRRRQKYSIGCDSEDAD